MACVHTLLRSFLYSGTRSRRALSSCLAALCLSLPRFHDQGTSQEVLARGIAFLLLPRFPTTSTKMRALPNTSGDRRFVNPYREKGTRSTMGVRGQGTRFDEVSKPMLGCGVLELFQGFTNRLRIQEVWARGIATVCCHGFQPRPEGSGLCPAPCAA